MNIQEIDISEIRANDYNPNAVDNDKMAVLRRFIERFGFLQPIVVKKEQNGYVIVDGEHRFTVMKEMGKKTIPAVITEMTAVESKMQTVNMNRLRGSFDNIKLAEVIAELRQHYNDEEIFDMLGFTTGELNAFDKLIGITPERLKFSEDDLDKTIREIEVEDASMIKDFAIAGNGTEMAIVEGAIQAMKEARDFTNDEAAVEAIFQDFVDLQ